MQKHRCRLSCKLKRDKGLRGGRTEVPSTLEGCRPERSRRMAELVPDHWNSTTPSLTIRTKKIAESIKLRLFKFQLSNTNLSSG